MTPNCERIPRKGKRLQWTGENNLEVMAFLAQHKMIGELFREGQHIMIYREQSYFDTLDHGMWLIEGEDGLLRIYTDDKNKLMYQPINDELNKFKAFAREIFNKKGMFAWQYIEIAEKHGITDEMLKEVA